MFVQNIKIIIKTMIIESTQSEKKRAEKLKTNIRFCNGKSSGMWIISSRLAAALVSTYTQRYIDTDILTGRTI